MRPFDREQEVDPGNAEADEERDARGNAGYNLVDQQLNLRRMIGPMTGR
jgi:hypothetical protein